MVKRKEWKGIRKRYSNLILFDEETLTCAGVIHNVKLFRSPCYMEHMRTYVRKYPLNAKLLVTTFASSPGNLKADNVVCQTLCSERGADGSVGFNKHLQTEG